MIEEVRLSIIISDSIDYNSTCLSFFLNFNKIQNNYYYSKAIEDFAVGKYINNSAKISGKIFCLDQGCMVANKKDRLISISKLKNNDTFVCNNKCGVIIFQRYMIKNNTITANTACFPRKNMVFFLWEKDGKKYEPKYIKSKIFPCSNKICKDDRLVYIVKYFSADNKSKYKMTVIYNKNTEINIFAVVCVSISLAATIVALSFLSHYNFCNSNKISYSDNHPISEAFI